MRHVYQRYRHSISTTRPHSTQSPLLLQASIEGADIPKYLNVRVKPRKMTKPPGIDETIVVNARDLIACSTLPIAKHVLTFPLAFIPGDIVT